MYKRLTYTDRLKIEALYNANVPVKIICEQLHFNNSSIYREIKRGLYKHKNTDWTYTEKYSANKAQQVADYNRISQGRQLKIGNDYKFLHFVEDMIINKKYSPEATLGYIKENGIQFKTKVCRVTLYSYIDKGLFPHLTNRHLLVKSKRRKYRKVRPIKQPPRGVSIEKRSPEINSRSSFGHWEMDSVIGSRTKGNTLLVFTERLTRKELIFKSPDKTALSTVNIINGLERKLGKRFSEVFKTITCDNGCEFSACEEIEKSCLNGNRRTQLYYCHPYCSCERGSNENQNKFIRRFIPKGVPIENYTDKDIKQIQDFINAYPRKMFGYKNSNQLFESELSKLGIKNF